ncbi:HD-GYP domain-containing protein [Pseudoduganella ginsengisoli]
MNLIKLPVAELQLGMYIEKMAGPWLASPFWQRQLLLDNVDDLNKLRASTIREVWINLAKSTIVVSPAGSADAPAPPAEPAAITEPAPPPAVRPALNAIVPVGIADELEHATVLLKKSREAVQSMFMEARMGKAISMEAAAPLVDEIAESVLRNSDAMIGLARLKTSDDYTYMHSVAVCALMVALGKQLNLDDDALREAGMAGLLHDIGKMAIPLTILQKPGKLSDEEYQQIKRHPKAGYDMLASLPMIPAAALDVCLHHHEKIDGSGYPEGLKGGSISLYSRMGAICDVYDAITSNRPYKQGWCPAESLRRMAEWSKGHFDERIFAAFVKCLGIYPIGTLVRLKSERIGVVVEQATGKPLTKPKVRVFYSAKSRSYLRPELIDLSAPGVKDGIASTEEAATWGLEDIDRYWSGEVEFI